MVVCLIVNPELVDYIEFVCVLAFQPASILPPRTNKHVCYSCVCGANRLRGLLWYYGYLRSQLIIMHDEAFVAGTEKAY